MSTDTSIDLDRLVGASSEATCELRRQGEVCGKPADWVGHFYFECGDGTRPPRRTLSMCDEHKKSTIDKGCWCSWNIKQQLWHVPGAREIHTRKPHYVEAL